MSSEYILYILGNGFDLHHGIPSRFLDFCYYLRKHDPGIWKIWRSYFGLRHHHWYESDGNISDLVQRVLTGRDTRSSAAYRFFKETGKPFFSHHFAEMTARLKPVFLRWVFSLNNYPVTRKRFNLKENACYLNFNLTDTLERFYGIRPGSIHYIRGKAQVFISREEPTAITFKQDRRLYFERKEPEQGTLRQERNNLRFAYSKITAVAVIGHSLAGEDYAYFEGISRKVSTEIPWIFTVYEPEDDLRARHLLEKLKLPPEKTRFINLNPFRIKEEDLFHSPGLPDTNPSHYHAGISLR